MLLVVFNINCIIEASMSNTKNLNIGKASAIKIISSRGRNTSRAYFNFT